MDRPDYMWIGCAVIQIKGKLKGRKGIVEEVLRDESNQLRVRVKDGWWCPVSLLAIHE